MQRSTSDHENEREYRELSDDTKQILRQEARFSGASIPGDTTEQVRSEHSPSKQPREQTRSKGWFRLGFTAAIFLACALAVVYRHGEAISENCPTLERGIVTYLEIVDRGHQIAAENLRWLGEYADVMTDALGDLMR